MKPMRWIICTFGLTAAIAIGGKALHAQGASDPNAAPNAYHVDDSWHLQLLAGRKLGAPIGVENGGETCAGSNLDPIFKLDASGKPLANFGDCPSDAGAATGAFGRDLHIGTGLLVLRYPQIEQRV